MKKRTKSQIGKANRLKGKVGERAFREMAKNNGLIVKWQAGDFNLPDVNLEGFDVEVKYRGNVPICVYQWLKEKDADMVAMKRVLRGRNEKQDWLVVMKFDLLVKFLRQKEW